MKKQLILVCIATVIFLFLSAYAIKFADDVNGKKTEFRFVCQVDSGNLPCEFCWGYLYNGYKEVGTIKQTESDIVFTVITHDGVLPSNYKCMMGYMIDGELVELDIEFYPATSRKSKEWTGDICFTVSKKGKEWEIAPSCTNSKSISLENQYGDIARFKVCQ